MNTGSSVFGMGTWRQDVCLLGSFVVLLVLEGILPVRAQVPGGDSLSLAERYRTARFHRLVQPYLTGERTFPIQPVRSLPVSFDSVPGWTRVPDTSGSTARAGTFSIEEVRRVQDLERSWFRNRFSDVEWSFLGAGTKLTVFDTTRTRALRARLQAQFGEPTRTMAEVYSRDWQRAPDSTRDEPIQFAYWFIVNDSIPVRVTDVKGPQERGVIVSTDRRHRRRLDVLRAELLRPLRTNKRAPYVDYYYETETGRWYRVGFDGADFFRERVSRFDILPGQRPSLDSTRMDTSSEAEESDSTATSQR